MMETRQEKNSNLCMPRAKASISPKDNISRTSFSSISINTLFKRFSQHPSEEAGCICHYLQFQNSNSNKVIHSINPNPHSEPMLPTFPHDFKLFISGIIKFQILRKSVPKWTRTQETGPLILPEKSEKCWLDIPHKLYTYLGICLSNQHNKSQSTRSRLTSMC